jgi:hypothetical protein
VVAFYAKDAFLKTSYNTTQVLRHTDDSCWFFWDSQLFQTLSIKWDFTDIFYIVLFQICTKCNHTT